MKPTVLVITTVHWADDTRIRERLIRTLSPDFAVSYAARSPGPSDRSGLEFIELRGGRLRRNLMVLRLCVGDQWDILILHDPETLFAGIVARLIKQKPVVFDVHEDVPATALTRDWVPGWLRRPLSWAARESLRLAEKVLEITLAEPGYARLFRDRHPVFPNYPDTSRYPDPIANSNGEVVHLGDTTIVRGAEVAVDACSELGMPLRLIGRVAQGTRATLQARSGLGDRLVFEGVLPNPLALEQVAVSSVGLAPLLDIPNYRHSQPTKVLEYLALGVPVVASDLPGTSELVEGLDAVFLVDPGEPGKLAAGIRRATTKDVRDTAQAQAKTVRERFRWPAEEVSAFYLSLL